MRYPLTASARVAAWTVRGLSVLIGLALPLTLTAPATAETDVVRDDRRDGGLRSMTVTRSAAGLTVVTYFAKASDRHVFRVKQPGFRKPTFKIVWRTDRRDDRFIRVTTARRTSTRPPGQGLCTVRRAKWGGFGAGAASRRMEFHLAPSCLWLREAQDIPRFKLDQRAFDVSDGVKRQTDALGYSRYLTTRGPGTGLN